MSFDLTHGPEIGLVSFNPTHGPEIGILSFEDPARGTEIGLVSFEDKARCTEIGLVSCVKSQFAAREKSRASEVDIAVTGPRSRPIASPVVYRSAGRRWIMPSSKTPRDEKKRQAATSMDACRQYVVVEDRLYDPPSTERAGTVCTACLFRLSSATVGIRTVSYIESRTDAIASLAMWLKGFVICVESLQANVQENERAFRSTRTHTQKERATAQSISERRRERISIIESGGEMHQESDEEEAAAGLRRARSSGGHVVGLYSRGRQCAKMRRTDTQHKKTKKAPHIWPLGLCCPKRGQRALVGAR